MILTNNCRIKAVHLDGTVKNIRVAHRVTDTKRGTYFKTSAGYNSTIVIIKPKQNVV